MRYVNRQTGIRVLCVAVLAWATAGCVEIGLPASGDKTHAPLVPIFGMHDDPAFEDQQAQIFYDREVGWQTGKVRVTGEDGKTKVQPRGMRYPAPETLPQSHRTKPSKPGADDAEPLTNPVPVTEETLRYGKVAYLKTCGTCHGKKGKGGGPVGRFISALPSLTSERITNYTDGRIYRVITHGWARMWSYKSQLEPMERWAVVNYVRLLQRAERPKPWDYETDQD